MRGATITEIENGTVYVSIPVKMFGNKKDANECKDYLRALIEKRNERIFFFGYDVAIDAVVGLNTDDTILNFGIIPASDFGFVEVKSAVGSVTLKVHLNGEVDYEIVFHNIKGRIYIHDRIILDFIGG